MPLPTTPRSAQVASFLRYLVDSPAAWANGTTQWLRDDVMQLARALDLGDVEIGRLWNKSVYKGNPKGVTLPCWCDAPGTGACPKHDPKGFLREARAAGGISPRETSVRAAYEKMHGVPATIPVAGKTKKAAHPARTSRTSRATRAKRPAAPKKLTALAVETEIRDLSRRMLGTVEHLDSGGMIEIDRYDKHAKDIRVILTRHGKHTEWEVDDPKYVAALRTLAKKVKKDGINVTVAVKNPRWGG